MSIDRQVTLLEHLRASELLEPPLVEELSGLPEAADPDPRSLGRVLLQRRLLTRFQINLVAQGKARELRVGPYLILDKLGEGGMGQVYKAQHRHMSRVVALKVIRKEKLANPDSVKRFYQEVQAAAQLNNPNIVIAFDANQVGNTHYLAMEYVEGADLARQVKGNGPLPVALACEYARQAALGLQHAHEKGMVHRDIKPHNLLVGQAGGRPIVKILDMGLARLASQGETGLTQSGQVLGTPDYLAPEQAVDSKRADVRSDVYSLGCTLYYLLAGRAPFTGDSLTQVLLKHQMEDAPELTSLRREVPPALWGVVRTMMAKDPDDRYQSAAEVAEALAPFARGELPDLKPPAPPNTADDTGNSWATLEAGDEGRVVRKPSRSATRVQDEEDEDESPRRKKRGKDRAKGGGGKLPLLIGGAVAVPLLALLVAGLVVALTWKKKPDDGQGKNPPVVTDKGKEKEKDKGKPPDDPLELWAGVLNGHAGAVTRLAVSPDGKFAASRSADRTARVWDLRTGKVTHTFAGLQSDNGGLAFGGEGKRLLAGDYLKLREWDLATQKPVGAADRRGFELAADGKTALTVDQAGEQLTARVWDVAGGRERGQFVAADNTNLRVSFSPDGDRAVMVGARGILQMFDPKNGRSLRRVTVAGPTLATCVAYRSEDEAFVGCGDGSVHQVPLSKSGTSVRFKGRHRGPVWAVALSPDGTRLLTGSQDGGLSLWEVSSGTEVGRFEGHVGSVVAIVFCPDGARALSGGIDKTARVWDLSKPTTVPPPYQEPPPQPIDTPDASAKGTLFKDYVGWVNTVLFSPDGTQGIAQDMNHVRLFELPGGKVVRTFRGHTASHSRMAVSKDWKRLVTVGADKTIRVWEVDTGKELRKIEGHTGLINSVTISADGKLALTGAGGHENRDGKLVPVDPTFRLWDLDEGKELKRQETPKKHPALSVALSPDGKLGLIADQQGDWQVWDVEKWKAVWNADGLTSYSRFAFLPGGHEALVTRRGNDIDHFALSATNTPMVKGRLRGGYFTHCMGVSADGKEAATVESRHVRIDEGKFLPKTTIRVWDLATGKERCRLDLPRRYESVALSADRNFLMGGDHEGGVWLWDLRKLESGEAKPPADLVEVRQSLARIDVPSPVLGMSLSPDGKALAFDGLGLTLLDTATEKLGRKQREGGLSLTRPRFAPDNRHVLLRGSDKTLRLWDTKAESSAVTFKGIEVPTGAFDLSADGKYVIAASSRLTDGGMQVWEAATGKALRKIAESAQATFRKVRFSGDGTRVVTVGNDRMLRVWDFEKGTLLKSGELPGSGGDLALGRDGKRAYVSVLEQVVIWDLEENKEVGRLRGPSGGPSVRCVLLLGKDRYAAVGTGTLRKKGEAEQPAVSVYDLSNNREVGRFLGHEREVSGLAVSPDGRRLYSGSGDKTIRVWDLTRVLDPGKVGEPPSTKTETPKEKSERFVGHDGAINALAVSPDGSRVATGGQDGTVRVWDAATGKELHKFELRSAARCVGFSSTGSQVCASGAGSSGRVWSVEKGDSMKGVYGGKGSSMEACLLLPDGSQFVTGTGTRLNLWAMADKKGIQAKTLKGSIHSLAASPTSKALAAGDADGFVRIIDVASMKESPLSTHKGAVLALAYSAKGTRLVSAGADKVIVVRELRTNAVKRLTGHGGAVTSVAVSADGKWIVSGSKDRTVRLWHVGRSEEVKRYTGHQGAVEGVAFDPKGKVILSCGDGVREWALPPEFGK